MKHSQHHSKPISLSSLITILLFGPVAIFLLPGCQDSHPVDANSTHRDSDTHVASSHETDSIPHSDHHDDGDAHADDAHHADEAHHVSHEAHQEDHPQEPEAKDDSLMGKAKGLFESAKSTGSGSMSSAGKWVQDKLGDAQQGSTDAMQWANDTFKSLKDQGLTTAESTSDWLMTDWKNMESWEYEVVTLESAEPETLKTKMNELGKQGWDCIHVADGAKFLIFKRAKESYLRRLPFKDLLRLAPLLNQGQP